MSRVFVAAVFLLANSQQKLSVIATDSLPIEFEGDYSVHGGKKYSSSAELTSLAHSSALQAKSAVRNQQSAGIQAALGAHTGYAKAAIEAASTAQVALVAKQIIVQNIQRQVEDAQKQLLNEEAQYHQTLQAANAALNVVEQSQQQLTAASVAIATVQQSVTQSERAARAATQAAAAQKQMIQDAQQKLARLHEKLHVALEGLKETEVAALKAAQAAHIAQSNAAASAQLVVVNSASNQIDEHDGYHH